MREAFPRTAGQAIGAFQTRYAGFNPGPEVTQLAIHPRTAHHLLDIQPALFMEGDLLDTGRFGRLQIAPGGIAAVSGHLPGHTAKGLDMACEHRREALGIGRIAGFDHGIEDQTAAPAGQIELMPVVRLTPVLDDEKWPACRVILTRDSNVSLAVFSSLWLLLYRVTVVHMKQDRGARSVRIYDYSCRFYVAEGRKKQKTR